MTLVLSPEARMVRDTALDFFRERSPITELRRLRDARDADGFSRALWRDMAELGWTGFLVPEDHGGSGFGMAGLGQVMEAAGRSLAASPLVSTALLGASLLDLGGSAAQQAAHFPGLLAGATIMALALEEGSHHAPGRIALAAQPAGDGHVLNGRKTFVLDGHVADLLVVAARTAGGVTLFLLPADTPGIACSRTIMVDSRNAANIVFTDVAAPAGSVLGRVGGGDALLEDVLDRARAGLAAEMLGSASEAFERTVQYLKDRQQFGVPIGSFQALKHRAAQMFCEIEVTRSAVLAALSALDARANDAAALASLAKARAGDTFHLVGNEAIQMHGGIGMTDEHEIGFFTKRARVAAASFGDARFHRDRYATLMGS